MQKYKLKRNDGSTIYVHAGAGTELIFSPNGEVYVETDSSFSQLDQNLITQDRWEKVLIGTHSKIFAYVDFTREDGVRMHVRGHAPELIKGTELMPGTNTGPMNTEELLKLARGALAANDEVTVRIDDNF